MIRYLFIPLVCVCFLSCKNKQVEPQAKLVDIKTRLININQYISDKDKDIIEHFIRRQDWNMQFSDQGFFYEVLEQGELPLINTANQVMYSYKIELLDGTLCSFSEDNNPSIFTVGSSNEISGLHLGVKYLGKKGKARFIFPPQLAHGLIGDRDKIPPLAILVYYVEVIDFN